MGVRPIAHPHLGAVLIQILMGPGENEDPSANFAPFCDRGVNETNLAT